MENIDNFSDYTELSGLIFACPFGNAACSCPFVAIQKLPVDERIEFIESLSYHQKISLLHVHKNCLATRETKKRTYTNVYAPVYIHTL